MSTYQVGESENGLPDLIDRVIAGDEVIITRAGRPVAQLRSTAPSSPEVRAAALERLLAHQITPPPGAPTSVELLHTIHDEPRG